MKCSLIGAENAHVDHSGEDCEPEHVKFETSSAWLAANQSNFYAKAAPGYKQVAPTGQFQSPLFDKIEKHIPMPMID